MLWGRLRPAPLHALSVGRAGHFSAESPHDRDFFLGEALRHEQSHLVAAIHADQREPDAGVSCGCLDNRATGRELSFLLRAPDDPNRRAVFHTAAGIQVLELGENVRRSGRNQPLQPQHGSFADQLGDIVGNTQAGHFRSFRSHVTGYGERAESSMEPKVGEGLSLRHPEARRSSGEGGDPPTRDFEGDPSFRLKSGSARDDATVGVEAVVPEHTARQALFAKQRRRKDGPAPIFVRAMNFVPCRLRRARSLRHHSVRRWRGTPSHRRPALRCARR
jgi:hypothetical protein